MHLESKARSLVKLKPVLKKATVLPQVAFSVQRWLEARDECIDEIKTQLGLEDLIVRSSSHVEDKQYSSNAGHFETVKDVSGQQNLIEAVTHVIESYGSACDEVNDEVLIQQMLRDVLCSGVAFTVDPNTCAPYRVVNYELDGDTAGVTSGKGGETYVHAAASTVPPPEHLKSIIDLLDEIESLVSAHSALDVEFAIAGSKPTLYLLQVRPLVIRQPIMTEEALGKYLQKVEAKVVRGLKVHPFLHGKTGVYGIMPDWNPAEIIGVRPKPLALSLYREIVTDSIWAYQRNNYGYKNLRSFPLLVHYYGLPYVDVRVSFNSFIPREIESGLAGKLVDYYIDRLLGAPNLHDKIEFDVVFSCYTMDLQERLSALKEAGFSPSELRAIEDSLRGLTNRIINKNTGLWCVDRDKLAVLEQRREIVQQSDLDKVGQIYWLLEDCKRYGTLPFAGLARAGFIAVQMLRSLVATDILSESEYTAFMAGIHTESGQLVEDQRVLDKEGFLAKYGHLRPGTYDILSPRYDQNPELYFDWSKKVDSDVSNVKPEPFSPSTEQLKEIDQLLLKVGLSVNAAELFEFLEAGILLREKSKFLFTRNLSDALMMIETFGSELGFDVSDLAYADIGVFYEMHAAGGDERALLERSIDHGRSRYEITKRLWLPPLISSSRDVWSFNLPESEPNYVTQKSVVAPVATGEGKSNIAGHIVMIPNADPGYDWLFSHSISGLITMYGGVNSHMAIRAGELGLPAVIGAGESLYRKWSHAGRLAIECANKKVEILS